jgi:hypothetical protein
VIFVKILVTLSNFDNLITNTNYEIVTLECKMGMSGQIYAPTAVSAGEKKLTALLEQVNECTPEPIWTLW